MKTLFFLLLLNGGFITTAAAQDTLTYWPNGKKKLKIDVKTDKYIAWYESGNKKEEGGYKMGGEWKFWDNKGTLLFKGKDQSRLSEPYMIFGHSSNQRPAIDTVYIKNYKNDTLVEGLMIREYEWVHMSAPNYLETGAFGAMYQLKKKSKEGYWRYYKYEKLTKEEWYKKGKLIKKINY